MNKLIDRIIRRELKIWALDQNPPPNGRARLLLTAARSAYVQDQSGSSQRSDGSVWLDAASRPFMVQTTGSFYQPLLWVLHLNLTSIRTIT